MKITNIEIKNFRAFYGTYQIALTKKGKNLLVYGENGSGKSSLYMALKLFFASQHYIPTLESIRWNKAYFGFLGGYRREKTYISLGATYDFSRHQNIFCLEDGYIKLHFQETPHSIERIHEWSSAARETEDPFIVDAAKAKGFLDYKSLLDMHYYFRASAVINVFEFLTSYLLAEVINDVTTHSFAEDWAALQWRSRPRKDSTTQIASREEKVQNFNSGLASKLEDLKEKASEILGKFRYNIALNFEFRGITYDSQKNSLGNQEILLTVEAFDKDIPSHHHFLNEAKLSAIALSIYFAALLLQPDSALKLLVLDDVLTGLDMSSRFPILDILEEYFKDYQIFLMTYDKAWYEIVKQRTEEKDWKYTEFYFKTTDEYEIPVCKEDAPYLKKAKEYLDANDYKACAVYVRTAFETIIEGFCESKHLPVRYHRNPNKQDSEHFWNAIKIENKKRIEKQNPALLDQGLIKEIELYRTRILNPLSHADVTNICRKELEDALEAVEQLENALG